MRFAMVKQDVSTTPMTAFHNRLAYRIEEASLNAWPAREQRLLDGWVIRFGDGYTKRANSVTALYPSRFPSDEKIARCEAVYRRRNLPAIFRITTLSDGFAELDQQLAERGYRKLEPTLVLQGSLANLTPIMLPTVESTDIVTWSKAFDTLAEHTPRDGERHRSILERIHGPFHAGILRDHDQIAACCLAVLEAPLVGLFDLVVHPEQRRRGLGYALCRVVLEWARNRGATAGYLQVVADNRSAVDLYRKLGFDVLYEYWYRHHTGPHASQRS